MSWLPARFWPMEFRHLDASGMKVSEITYGSWITHGGQVEDDTIDVVLGDAVERDAAITGQNAPAQRLR